MIEVLPRPTIAQLEELKNRHADGAVEIKPDGSVWILTLSEIAARDLVLEREKNALLLREITRLRSVLRRIADLAMAEAALLREKRSGK